MNINELTIGEAKELANLFQNTGNSSVDIASHYKGKYCIFRTYSAGVFFGILKERSGLECIIAKCRRIWSWEGAFTLSKIASNGVSEAKLSIEEPEKLATQVIEIIPCTEMSTKQLTEMVDYNG